TLDFAPAALRLSGAEATGSGRTQALTLMRQTAGEHGAEGGREGRRDHHRKWTGRRTTRGPLRGRRPTGTDRRAGAAGWNLCELRVHSDQAGVRQREGGARGANERAPRRGSGAGEGEPLCDRGSEGCGGARLAAGRYQSLGDGSPEAAAAPGARAI